MGQLLAYLPFILSIWAKYGDAIRQLIDIGSTTYDAIKKAAPILAPIVKEIASKAFPETTSDPVKWEESKQLTAKAIFTPHRMTREEEERWFKAQETSSG